MAIFDSRLFDPNIFVTDQTSSGTDSSVVEKKKGRKSRGRSKSFKWFGVKKEMRVVNEFRITKTVPVTAFRITPASRLVETCSVNLDDVDSDEMIEEANRLVLSAASKTMDPRSFHKVIQTVSMKPKSSRLNPDRKTLLTVARELIESARDLMGLSPGELQLLEKPSLPQVEPSLYGDVPLYDFGEVEFQIDRKSHKEPDECDDYNGQVFSYGPDGLEDGAPIPPLHPFCACRLIDTKTRQPMYFPGSEWDTG